MNPAAAAQVVGVFAILFGVTVAGGWVALVIALGVLVFAVGVLLEWYAARDRIALELERDELEP